MWRYFYFGEKERRQGSDQQSPRLDIGAERSWLEDSLSEVPSALTSSNDDEAEKQVSATKSEGRAICAKRVIPKQQNNTKHLHCTDVDECVPKSVLNFAEEAQNSSAGTLAHEGLGTNVEGNARGQIALSGQRDVQKKSATRWYDTIL